MDYNRRATKHYIIFLIGNYKNGGVAARATNLGNQFADRGYEVILLVQGEVGEERFIKLHSHVSLVALSAAKKTVSKRASCDAKLQKRKINLLRRMRDLCHYAKRIQEMLSNRINGIKSGQELRLFLVDHAGDVLIPFGFENYKKTVFAANGLGCKIIYAEKNATQMEFSQDVKTKEKAIRLLMQADAAVFQTEDERAFFQGRLTNAYVIHNPIKEGLPLPYTGKRRHVIVNFCRISPQKNLPLLIKAFEKLHCDFPEYSLQIYGNTVFESEIRLRDELTHFVEAIDLSNSISILPAVSDVHERVRDCAMFISSSDYEGLSNSMIEAMAIGMPCICTDCLGGGAKEMIIHGENGLLVPVGDVEALYHAMKEFIQRPDFAEECGRKAAFVREKLSATQITDEWLELIESMA